MFYFVRHGKTDYTQRNTKVYQGFGVNLSPLSAEGVAQIKATARDERLQGTELILCSPYTRAVQTAAILSRELGAEIVVETDLHEWLANKHFHYDADAVAEESYREYVENGGRYPANQEKIWESAEAVRRRVLAVLQRYRGYRKVIVAGHGLMIQSATQGPLPRVGEITKFDFQSGAEAL